MKKISVKLCFSLVRKAAGRYSRGLPRAATRWFFLPALGMYFSSFAWSGVSQDAYVRRAGDSWILGTTKVERTVALQNGRLVTTSWKNKVSGKQLIPAGAPSDELRVGVEGQEISGLDGNWQLTGAQDHTLAQGEIQLDISLRHGSLEAT